MPLTIGWQRSFIVVRQSASANYRMVRATASIASPQHISVGPA
ncbi:MAG TPA: hypothetical protein VGZ91_20400 [Candidatus Sulfotelmatobacter sp.]|nr:hypothetical protein [Candidatus Sulfotelmatobacter sp.]